jgi:hypothetical protein
MLENYRKTEKKFYLKKKTYFDKFI